MDQCPLSVDCDISKRGRAETFGLVALSFFFMPSR